MPALPTRIHRDERGLTLVELLVASVIVAIVGTVLFGALESTMRIESYTSEDSQTLALVRSSLDRLEKELRQARKLYTESTGTLMKMWVDYDRDNQQDPVERITWQLTTVGPSARLTRTSDAAGAPVVVLGRDFVPGTAFQYSPAPPNTSVVTVTFTADVRPGARSDDRTIETRITLRNVDA